MTIATPDCPRCAVRLSRLRIGGIDTDVCEQCGGVWLDTDELASIRR